MQLPRSFRHLFTYAFIIATYVFLGQAALSLASINSTTSPVWPASGFAIAALILFGLEYWPAIFIATLIVNFLIPLPIVPAILIAAACTIEAYCGVILYNRLKKSERVDLGTAYVNLLAVATISSLVSAALGCAALLAAGIIAFPDFTLSFVTWLLADTVGVIALLPAILYFARHLKSRESGGYPRIILSTALIAAITSAIFLVEWLRPFIFILLPLLLLSLGIAKKAGVYFASLTICLLATLFTSQGMSPFSWGTFNQNFLALQIFLGVLALTAYFIISLPDVAKPQQYLRPLLIGWSLAGIIFYSYYTIHSTRDHIRLAALTEQYSEEVQTRFNTYVNILRDGVGLFAASKNVTREEWRAYVAALNLHDRFPGIRGMGLIRNVSRKNLNTYLEEQRASYPDYHRQALTSEFENSSNFFLIQYIEPLAANSLAMGIDIGSEKYRREIAERSIETGRATMSRPIQLLQDKKQRASFLLLVPFYKSDTFRGWIYAPIVLEDFLADALISKDPELDFDVNYIGPTNKAQVFHTHSDSIDSQLQHTATTSILSLGEGQFEFVWRKNSRFLSSHDFTLSWVGALGALLVITFTSMLISSATFREQAEAMVLLQTRVISEKQRLLHTLMEAAPVGIMHLSPSGKFVYANSKWTEISGYTAADISPISRQRMVFSQDLATFEKAWDGFVADLNPFDLRFRIVSASGEIKWIQTIATKIRDEANKIEGFVAVVVDVTEAMAHQVSLEIERAKAVESSKLASLGEMAGGIAHEINNPLMIIKAQAEQLLRISNEERLVSGMTRIEKTVDRIAKIIKGMRALSRNSDNDEFTFIKASLVIEDVIDLCQERFRHSSIRISVEIKQDFEIFCRSTQISQVLLNLLNNSYDAVKTTEKPWVKIRAFTERETGFIEVTDSGHGIAPDIALKIMDPFFTTKSVEKGTGLGLSISRNIMRDHKAEFYLDTKAKNTTFVLEFNLRRG